MSTYLFTSESVTEGHPDKVADQISDAVLDEAIRQDEKSRVACETLVTTNLVLLAGEITTQANLDFDAIARKTIKDIGYTELGCGFDYSSCEVLVRIDPQSPDIKHKVDPGGAGDQGLMFGYACQETDALMPLPIMLAHRLTRRLAEIRKNGKPSWLKPDGKSQVTVEYQNGQPKRVHTVVISTQHASGVASDEIQREVIARVILPTIPDHLLTSDTTLLINQTGSFEIGGPQADCGLTGRKIIVDTYGGRCPHGGGAFSGKDPTKVDRSASYMARHIAKNLVAAGLAEQLLVQLAYVIGVADPIAVHVNSYNTANVSEQRLEKLIRTQFPLTPSGIIEHLQLRRPLYKGTAAYGHFGRNVQDHSWEALDHIEQLRGAAT